ncbi:MAG TPA: methyltransferase domain-containing protein, partial [Candidatus Baltobacteraceae bacterium]|nr:methyltransferase domain-containing protein [Candidatus Baltobacteraceae bacterium]
WLRSHPEDRELYEHVKRQLVKREWETREHYADAKSAVVDTIMRRAHGESYNERIEHVAVILLERLPANPRVLEIGAGEGLLARRLTDAGHHVVALDTASRSTFPITERSFESFEAPAESFDCIAAQLVLHHAAGLSATLAKMERLLAPGGLVAIDDYGWERSADAAYREQRRDLHTSQTMLEALRERFEETGYAEHGFVRGAEGDGRLGFTFIGTSRAVQRVMNPSNAASASSIPKRP